MSREQQLVLHESAAVNASSVAERHDFDSSETESASHTDLLSALLPRN